MSVDQRVTAPQAYNATNDQVAYGRLGALWLFKQLGGKGNVVEMRGIAGVPADTDRHTGFQQALKKYPGIKVVKQTFTGWQFATGGKQMLDILNSGVKVDGVWTSGIDYTVVNAFKTAGKPLVPVVGADNNEFLSQLLTTRSFQGAGRHQPGHDRRRRYRDRAQAAARQEGPEWVKLTPQVWDMTTSGQDDIKANYSPKRPPTYSSQLRSSRGRRTPPQQLYGCKGP